MNQNTLHLNCWRLLHLVGLGTFLLAQSESFHPLNPPLAEQRAAISNAFIHAWTCYEQLAWGSDELKPIAQQGTNWLGGIGLTIIDSLDTAWIMGLESIYQKGRDWIERNVSFSTLNQSVCVFEMNIRILGGLLSCHSLTNDSLYLKRAEELAFILKDAWRDHRMPATNIWPLTGQIEYPKWTNGNVHLSEVGTYTLEALYLKQHGNDYDLWKYASQTILHIIQQMSPGLYPIRLDQHGQFLFGSPVKWGAYADSFYEYLLKPYLLGSTDAPDHAILDQMFQVYQSLITNMTVFHIEQHSSFPYYTYTSDQESLFTTTEIHEMDHLTCFVGGLLALGALQQSNPKGQRHLSLAKKLTRTCVDGYFTTPTRLSPEILDFSDTFMKPKWNAVHYLLRPETVETLFVLWRVTHWPIYRHWGWMIFLAIEEACWTPTGYTGIKNVSDVASERIDVQNSYFLAETLKYLYLLFSADTLLSLDEWVFNTEGHPLRRMMRKRQRDMTHISPKSKVFARFPETIFG